MSENAMNVRKFLRQPINILCFLAFLFASCQPGVASGPKITIEDPWGRPSTQMASMGAFYMVIRNTGDESDTLLSAQTPACGMVEFHESIDMGDGVMGMQPVEGGKLEIPANSLVELKVGGLHMMCMQIQIDFQEGGKVPLTLTFEKTGTLEIEVEIKSP